MTKAERVKKYNELYEGYHITNIKRMTQNEIDYYRHYGKGSLHELYKQPSQAKLDSWRKIWVQYEPLEILGFVGSSHTYSVMLVAKNGSLLHITPSNNYLVEVK